MVREERNGSPAKGGVTPGLEQAELLGQELAA